MDLIYVKKLIKLLSESDVDEIEIEEEGKKIRVVKHGNAVGARGPLSGPAPVVLTPSNGSLPVPVAPAVPASLSEAPAAQAETTKFHEIKCPIVGTFYRAPAPDAEPFVQVGSTVSTGSVLCIVEAMKLMNEIESDISGKIVKILVENGQPVEYDQTLFLVEAA